MEPKDKIERKLKKVKISLMRNTVFAQWGPVMMVGKTEVVDYIPTACTNGRDELYGRGFLTEQSEKQIAWTIIHENLHKQFRHMTTWVKLWKEDHRLCNMACDYVINLLIAKIDPNEQWLVPPTREGKQFILIDKRFEGMHTKQVFDILKKEKEEGGGGEDGEPGDGGGGFDEHDFEGAKDMTEEEKKVLEREIERAIKQGEMNHKKLNGTGAGGLSRELDSLSAPQIDWKEALREFITSHCTAKDTSSWRRVNRRMLSAGYYMPSLIGETVSRVSVGVDTSGSIDVAGITVALSEFIGMAKAVNPEKIDLIYWDHVVAGHEEYTSHEADNILNSTRPVGGGGTSPTSMMAYLKEKNITPDCIIMITDGCIGDWGTEWNAPVLWVVVGNPGCTAPTGKTLHINHGDY